MGGYLDGSTDGYAGTIEVLEGRSGRRLRSEAERARMGAESLVPGAKVADIARRHGVVIPPFLRGLGRRIYAAILSFWAGVMPPLPMLGRSLL
jgi:hypothetical protein